MTNDPTRPFIFEDDHAAPEAPPVDKRGESMVDVMGRVARVAAAVEDGQVPAASRATLTDVATTATSPAGEVDVSVRENELVGLRLDDSWLRDADALTVEELVRDTVNRALRDFREQAVQQVLRGRLPSDGLAARIAELQTDMHHAFQNDLTRAVAPAAETVRRFGGGS